MRNVPWWGLVSSAAIPVLLVGGWSGATRLQPQSAHGGSPSHALWAPIGHAPSAA